MIAMQQNSQNTLNIWRVIYIVHKLILEIQQKKKSRKRTSRSLNMVTKQLKI
jgi:hypothetical protein